jgi:hypothetical protein
MKPTNTKKFMQMSLWKNTLVVATLLMVLFPILAEAGTLGKAGQLSGQNVINVTKRPLSDFLDAQGTLNNPPVFFPPVKDYSGWANNPATTFALVDYAGLADKYIQEQTGHSLGTKVNGSVMERVLADGKTQITVVLSAMKALGFAQSVEEIANNNWDFLSTPTIFGAKAQDVVNGAEPAVGQATLLFSFSISAPGAPLPDILDVFNNWASYAPVNISFTSTTVGKRPDGKKATLHIRQVASTNDQNQPVWSMEKVELVGSASGK